MYEFISLTKVEVTIGDNKVKLEYIPVGWIREIQEVIKSRMLVNMVNDTELSLVAHVWKGKPHLLVGGVQVPMEEALDFLDYLVKIMIDMRQTNGGRKWFNRPKFEKLSFSRATYYSNDQSKVPVPAVQIGHSHSTDRTILPIQVILHAINKMDYKDWWNCHKNLEYLGVGSNTYAKLRSTTSGMLAISLTQGDEVEVWHFTAMEFEQLIDYLKVDDTVKDKVMNCILYKM